MPNSTIRTVFVIPDEQFRINLYAELRRHNFLFCGEAATAGTGLSLVHRERPNLALIDFSLPNKQAVSLCQEVQRLDPSIQNILIVDEDDQLPPALMQYGVAGVVKRTFPHKAWPGVLAYIHAGGAAFSRRALEQNITGSRNALVTARHKGFPDPVNGNAAPGPTVITIGALQLDLSRRRVLLNNRRVHLTPREYALLACLARHLDHVVTVDQLLNEVWGYGADHGEPAQVRMYIARLRRKLNPNEPDTAPIFTERGVGYRLTDRVADSAAYCMLPSLLHVLSIEKAATSFLNQFVSALRLRPMGSSQQGHRVASPATSRVEQMLATIKASINDWLHHPQIEAIEENVVAFVDGAALVGQVVGPHLETALLASLTLASFLHLF
ncbi:MAG: response regulator transcription factor [Caldilineaceae bacterium]|nr:response regulator transcription factor [Caldilineaceae bacterium]